MSGKRRLTGQEAIDRLFWDVRINRDAFVLGYADRRASAGVRELPLLRWDPQGNIPSHRIVHLRCGSEVVWSRDGAVDRLADEDLPDAAWAAEQAAGTGRFRPRSVYCHLAGKWEVATAAPTAIDSFRLITWNVMHDFGDQDVPSLGERMPLLVAELDRASADVIALQEAAQPLVRHLLERPRSHPLYLAEPPDLAGLAPHGTFLLSRHPFTVLEHAGGGRPVLVGTWTLGERLLRVANLHLPSNRTADANLHRRRLLAGLFADLQPMTGDLLVVGDFNLRGDELSDLIAEAGFGDAWCLLRPGEEGCTFDPPRNALARQASRSGLPVRFDRVLWRPASGGFTPVSVDLLATAPRPTPAGPCFASDHYGLCSAWEAHPAPAPAVAPSADLTSPLDRLRPEATDEQRRTCQEIVGRLAALVERVTGRANAVHLAGSWRLDVPGPDSDIDLVCLHPPELPRRNFFDRLQEGLRQWADDVCLAEGARVPRLSFRFRGLKVDAVSAGTSHERLPRRAVPSDFIDEPSWQAARACVECDSLLEAVADAMPAATFRQLLRAVRAWAAARQVHGNGWGFLGGFPWAILTAWTASQPGPKPDGSTAAFLAHFFRMLTQHPWPRPVALTVGQHYQPEGPRDRLPVIRPAEPAENAAYNVTRSTAGVLRSEWARAARLLEGGVTDEALARLFAPVDLRAESEQFLVVSLERAEMVGELEGRFVGLLLDLERRFHLFVRPWPGANHRKGTWRVTAGLPVLRQREVGAVRRLARDVLAGLGGAEGGRWRVEVRGRGGTV